MAKDAIVVSAAMAVGRCPILFFSCMAIGERRIGYEPQLPGFASAILVWERNPWRINSIVFKLHSSNSGMKKTLLMWGTTACLMMAACAHDKETSVTEDKFQVTSPIVMDTFYTTDYVADIQAIQNVELRARAEGFLERIFVDEGQSVHAGQTLFVISSQAFRQAVASAQATLKNAQAEAKTAELELNNVKVLAAKNVVSSTEMELAESKLNALKAKIEEAEAALSTAQLQLSFSEIKAPFDGIIDRIPNKVGSLVEEGTLLTTISNSSDMFAYFNMSEQDYLSFVKADDSSSRTQALTLVLANGEDHPHAGKLETIDAEFDKHMGTIAFRARFPNPDGILKHGASGKVKMVKKLKDAMLIPQKSTFEMQDKLYVFVVDEKGKVSMRPIVSKLRLSELYVIGNGLSQQDRFVYEGIQKVDDGGHIEANFVPLKSMMSSITQK